MKKLLLISLLVAASTAVTFAQGRFTTTTGTTSTGNLEIRLPGATPAPSPPRATAVPPVILAPKEGAVQMAIRTGQPIQLINPTAPASFGSGHERVTHDPDDPAKPKGIALFAWTF